MLYSLHRRSSPFALRASPSSLAVHFHILVICIPQLRSHLWPLASSAPCSDPVVVPHQLRLLDAAFASSNLYDSLVVSHGRRANDKLVSILSESDRIETQLVVHKLRFSPYAHARVRIAASVGSRGQTRICVGNPTDAARQHASLAQVQPYVREGMQADAIV